MLGAILGARTELHRLCMEACHRQSKGGREAPIGGRPPLGVIHPLTMSSHHCLRVVGYGLDMDHRRKAPFSDFLHVFVFVTCKTISSKYMWNLVNSKGICV